ncbi:S8 family serine peptidase [Streptomyces sp. NPDC047973]|uniref:S8 family serine peptidase n=1 Tax=Streptomyces sp. NPDC047973 TaxID=3155383 RepID=UPI00343AF88C
MIRHRPRHRGLLAAALAVALGAPFLGAAPAMAGPAEAPGVNALRQKAEGKVLADFEDHDRMSFWVQLDSEPDTSKARKAKTKTARGKAVVKAGTENARKTQAGLKSLLKKADAPFKSYWISNTVKVTGTKALAQQIAARSDVTAIQADDPVPLPEKLPAVQEAEVGGVEWNIDRIKAPKVWDDLGVRGEGVVVASIDTGVDVAHPALAASYRGTKADGSRDDAYNWFDATGNCANLSDDGRPCDDQGHGTHTMGTMVGDDGEGNAIGVAPGATWIAAKGCGAKDCTQEALLAAGQWILAPTDAEGKNPRPDLAPDVVNNSWGSIVLDPWYRSMVQAWRDAGIFPAYSAGNNGPSCDTVGSPGAYANSYATGALDTNDLIASFSSRGPGLDGTMKPDIAAPGANIRSAAPGGGYAVKSGTSMASPHTAATVALMWSASPSLRGDVSATEALLDSTAHDVDDTTCGGTAENNQVYGEGRLDAYAAVTAAPHDSLGALKGTVTTADGPAGDALVAVDGPMHATRHTGKDGSYSFPRLIAGEYTVTVSLFGYVTETATVTVDVDGSLTRDAKLAVAATGTVTGTVTSDSGPEADVVIKVRDTPVTATSDAKGAYSLTLPVGSYSLNLTPLNKCAAALGTTLDVQAGDVSKGFELATRTDATGTTCRSTDEEFPTGDTKLGIGPMSSYSAVSLPFPVALYGHTYDKGWVSLDGGLIFGYLALSGNNGRIPDASGADGVLYPFWDDLAMDSASGIYSGVKGTAPHRSYVVEWRDMVLMKDTARRVGFSAEISEDGTYAFHYKDIDAGGKGYEQGTGATIGAENHDGTQGFEYAANELSVRDGMTLRFRPERNAVVSGTVTDANDGKAVSGATVTVSGGGKQIATATTRADGAYLMQIPAEGPQEYRVDVTSPHYAAASRTAELKGLSVLRTESALTTGAVAVDRSEGWTLVVPAGQTRERGITLTNSGSAADWTVKEKAGAAWLTAGPAQGTLEPGASRQVTLTFSTVKATPGTVLKGTVVIASESGRTPVVELPVTLVVPGYQAAVDAGSGNSDPVTDGSGDSWGPDRAWVAGSYGYIGDPKFIKSADAITGTDEQQLYRTAGQGAKEYRFDGVPNGTYLVELGFAELKATQPGRRVFDVSAEGTEKVSNVDIALEAGGDHRALTKTFTVKVTDGRLDLALTPVKGQALVNSLRVTQRPDLKS